MMSNDKDIENRIASIEGLRAMTVNERLYLNGLIKYVGRKCIISIMLTHYDLNEAN